MAATNRTTLLFGSEEAFEIECDSCTADGKQANSLYFCEDCPANLCNICYQWHAKIPGTAKHKMCAIDHNGRISRRRSMPPPVPPSKNRKPFRKSATLDEKSSRGNAGPAVPPRPKIQAPQIKQPLLLDEMERIRQAKLEQLKQVDDSEKSNAYLLKKLLDKINAMAREESIQTHGRTRDALKSDIAMIDERIKAIKKEEIGNEQSDKDMLRQLRHSTTLKLEFPLMEKFRDVLIELESRHMSMSAEFQCEYDICTEKDKMLSGIFGACLLADGTIVLADNLNEKLKFLNRKTKTCSHVDLTCGPWGVCSTNLYEVAVTLTNYKMVQFVSVGKNISLTRSFSVPQPCRGICYNNGNLYISCGSVRQDSSGFVGVFHLGGQLIRRIDRDPAGQPIFSLPHHIAVTSSGDQLYVADKNNGALLVMNDGDVIRFRDSDLAKAFGICALDSGGFLVGGINSDTILHVSETGKNMGMLLSAKDGIDGPYSLLVDNTDSTLFVTFYESKTVKLFKLK